MANKKHNFIKYLNSLTDRINDSHIKFYRKSDKTIILRYSGSMDFNVNSWSNKKDFLFGSEYKKHHIQSFWEFCYSLRFYDTLGKLSNPIKVTQADPFIKICSECSSIEELEIKLAMCGY